MKQSQSKHDACGKLKDCVLYDQGRLVDNQRVGEWHVCDAKGRLAKTTKNITQ
jgi:hypothetical protein